MIDIRKIYMRKTPKVNTFVVKIKTTDKDIKNLLETAVLRYDPEIPFFEIVKTKRLKKIE